MIIYLFNYENEIHTLHYFNYLRCNNCYIMNIKTSRYGSILKRQGAKGVLSPYLIKLIPEKFTTLVSPFFGSGRFELNFLGVVEYLIVNDLDDNIGNFWRVLRNTENVLQLIEEIGLLPISGSVWEEYKDYKKREELTPIEKAMFFLMYSNWGYMGNTASLQLGTCRQKEITLAGLKHWYKSIVNNQKTTFQCHTQTFQKFLKSVPCRFEIGKNDADNTFVFADPPYLDTDAAGYDVPDKWTINDHELLQEKLIEFCHRKNKHSNEISQGKFMICEFAHPAVIEIANSNNLFVTDVMNRRNLKSATPATEIIITNYDPIRKKTKNLFE